MFEKNLWKSEDAGHRQVPQVFFKHSASKNQLLGLSASVILVENGLRIYRKNNYLIYDHKDHWKPLSQIESRHHINSNFILPLVFLNKISYDEVPWTEWIVVLNSPPVSRNFKLSFCISFLHQGVFSKLPGGRKSGLGNLKINANCARDQYVMVCAIWYHLYTLKNVKNTHGRMLPLVKY